MPADSNLAEPAADSNPAMPAETTGGGDTEFRPAPDAEDAIPVPENYTLQAYDDCGVLGRQPHMADASSYRFPDNTVDGPPRSLSVAFSQSGPITARYEDLDATAPYIVAVTYATERGSSRVQTLHAGTHVVHGPRPIPDGRAERCTSAVPPEAIQDGTLELTFSKVDGPNPVVAEIELWAPLPSPGVVHFAPWLGYDGSIAGRVTDVRFEPVGGVGITVSANGRPVEALTADDGTFHIEEAAVAATRPKDVFQVVVVVDEHSHEFTVPAEAFIFTRPVYRSIARSVAGVETSDLLLDGTWRIVSDFSQVDEAAAGRDCVVPGQTLQQGIDVTNDSVFGLSREFDLPVDWNGQRLFIRFEAVHGEAEYFLNGMRLGRSAVVYTPIEFDITAAARPGHANRLTVRLAADAALMADHLASSTRYAHHNPVGIHRSVRVFALPPNHIARAWVDPRVRPSLDAADLRVDLMVEQAGSGVRHDGAVSLVLRDLDGHAVALSQGAFPLSLPGERNEAELRCVVDKPRLWSAETPHLYTLDVTLSLGGVPVETIRRTIGFRRIETLGSQLLVNGQPVKLRGSNRHEIDPLTGRANTARHAETDARLFKEANCNLIRTSHYPPTREFLEACNRIGLYVEAEAPFCWTRGTEEDDPQHRLDFLRPTASMLEYHHAHPSIIVWSLGNESGWHAPRIGIPSNYAATNAYAKRLDPTRLTLFNNSFGNDGGLCDIPVIHYPPADDFSKSLVHPDDPRPVLIDEYLHVMCYNVEELRVDPGIQEEWALGASRFGPTNNEDFWSSESIWNRIYRSDRYLGVTIWAGIDEVFRFPDGSTNGYGPWGLIDGWRRTKPEWWHTKMMYSPVWIPSRRVDYDSAAGRAEIPIENRYSFTNLSSLAVRWRAGEAHGTVPGPDIAPGTHGAFEMDIPTAISTGEMLALEFLDADETVVVAWGLDLGEPEVRVPAEPGAGAPRWERDGDVLEVEGNGFRLRLDTATGLFEAGEAAGATVLRAFPTIHATQIERRLVFSAQAPPYAEMPDAATRAIDSVTAEERGGALAITLREHYEHFAGETEWLIDRNGVGVVRFDYVYTGLQRHLRELGVKIPLDAACQTLRWDRRALWGVYPDDHIGRPQGEAMARRDRATDQANMPPTWPWHLDETLLGTSDFRSTKFSIYQADLVSPHGAGLRVESDATASVRACLTPEGTMLHIVQAAPPGVVAPNARLKGSFSVRLLP